MLLKKIFNLESIIFTALTIFLIFNIKFKGLPPTFFIASVILFIMSIYYYFRDYKFPSVLLKPIIFFIFFIFAAMISFFKSGEFDFFLFSLIITLFFLITVAPYSYLSFFKGRELDIIQYIVYAGIVNAIFIIGMFLFSDFKFFYLSLLNQSDLISLKGEDVLDNLYSLRLVGLTGSATYGMAVTQTIMVFLYVYYVKIKVNRFKMLNYFVMSFLLISAIISGRTAFVGMILLFLFMFLIIKKIDSIKFVLLFLSLASSILILASIFLPENFYTFFENWIFQLFQKGEKIGSLEANINMFIYSTNDFSLFGDFKWHGDDLRTSYYKNTDVGWYRFLFAFGYVGVFLLLLFIISTLKFNFKVNKETLLGYFIVVFIFIVMLKGAILFDYYPIFFILIIITFLAKRKVISNTYNKGLIR